MAQAFGQLTAETGALADTDTNHLSLDGKTPRGGKDARPNRDGLHRAGFSPRRMA